MILHFDFFMLWNTQETTGEKPAVSLDTLKSQFSKLLGTVKTEMTLVQHRVQYDYHRDADDVLAIAYKEQLMKVSFIYLNPSFPFWILSEFTYLHELVTSNKIILTWTFVSSPLYHNMYYVSGKPCQNENLFVYTY